VELADEAVAWDLGSSVSYGEYLQLDKLLAAQKPLSSEHNEMLFIIVHQVSELWMRLMLHELTAALECVRRDDLDPALKMLALFAHPDAADLGVDVLSTMTPFEYSAFRKRAGAFLGFQSLQYRMLEFMFGNKNAEMSPYTSATRSHTRRCYAHWAAPSLYDEVLRLLSAGVTGFRGLPVAGFSAPYQASKQVAGAWLGVYHNADTGWTCTSSPSAWWTSTTISSCGAASPENRRAHIGYKPGTAAPAAFPISPRRWSSSSFRSCGRSGPRCDCRRRRWRALAARALRRRQRTRRYANSSASIPIRGALATSRFTASRMPHCQDCDHVK